MITISRKISSGYRRDRCRVLIMAEYMGRIRMDTIRHIIMGRRLGLASAATMAAGLDITDAGKLGSK